MSTYTPIATQTLSANTASVTFSSIPQGYTDLVLVSRMSNSNAATGFGSGLTLNNDAVATGKLSFTILYGNGSAAGSFRWTTSTSGNVTVPLGIEATTLNAGGMSVMQLMNYSNSTTFKTILTRGGAAGLDTLTYVSLWQDKSPINKITIYPNDATNTILSGSTFSIYGIQVGNAAQKAQGGNIVTTDGTYVYHTFTSSGSFIPSQALTADYLVVAGGGGGGSFVGGGGGAGGYRTSIGGSALSLTAKSYPVIVGSGGAGAPAPSGFPGANGSAGSNSVFGTITSSGGGYGGTYNTAGGSGGSGGGGGASNPSGGSGGTGNAGSYSPSEGNNGGSGFNYNSGTQTDGTGGGGGGSSVAGTNAGSTQPGNGGNGTTNSISGSSITYAGGGGGGCYNDVAQGSGGTGGGGAGGAQNATGQSGVSGTVNLGGGGGGGSQGTTSGYGAGGNGGSGIVIIRYAL
jgi:hypothetical protein